MPSILLRIAAAFVSIGGIATGVLLLFIYDGIWYKFCSVTIIIAGIYYGSYAFRRLIIK